MIITPCTPMTLKGVLARIADGGNFKFFDLVGIDLSDADLGKIVFYGAHLTGANLTNAKLDGANLTNAKLDGANLTNAKLDGANLTNAKLDGAKLDGANLTGAKMDSVDFTVVSLENISLASVSSLKFARFANRAAARDAGVAEAAIDDLRFAEEDAEAARRKQEAYDKLSDLEKLAHFANAPIRAFSETNALNRFYCDAYMQGLGSTVGLKAYAMCLDGTFDECGKNRTKKIAYARGEELKSICDAFKYRIICMVQYSIVCGTVFGVNYFRNA